MCGLTPSTWKKLPATQPMSTISRALAGDQAQPLRVLAGEAGEHGVAVAEGDIQGIRERVKTVAVLRPDAPAFHAELDQLARVLHRQQPEQHLVDQREDRRVGGNAERQRQHGRGGKPRVEPQHADAVPDVLSERLEQWSICHGGNSSFRDVRRQLERRGCPGNSRSHVAEKAGWSIA